MTLDGDLVGVAGRRLGGDGAVQLMATLLAALPSLPRQNPQRRAERLGEGHEGLGGSRASTGLDGGDVGWLDPESRASAIWVRAR